VLQEDRETLGKAPEKMERGRQAQEEVEHATVWLVSGQPLRLEEGVLEGGHCFRMGIVAGGMLRRAQQIVECLVRIVRAGIVIRQPVIGVC
jgi:hypothetical protein